MKKLFSTAFFISCVYFSAPMDASANNLKTKLGGRIHLDSAFYRSDAVRLENGSEARRARLSAKGTINDHFFFKGQYDFAGDAAAIKDLFLGIKLKKSELILGNQKMGQSISALTSSNFPVFMEFALPVAAFFSPSRSTGAQLYASCKMLGFQLGVFGDETSNNGAKERIAQNARIFFFPINGPDRLLHLGASFVYSGHNDSIQINTRPEARVDSTKLVDTGALADAYDQKTAQGEMAFIIGPLSFQGEYFYSNVKRIGQGDLEFSGYYGFLSLFLTKEHRKYVAKRGVWGGITPNKDLGKGGPGAVELATRFSYIDLKDDDVDGGHQKNFTLGLNWYFNKQVRLMFNQVWANSKKGTVHDDPSVSQFRFQVFF